MEVYSGEYVGKTMPWTHDWEWFQHTTYGDDWGAISIWRFHKVMGVPEKNHPAIGIFRIFHERVTIQRCFWGPPWLWKPDEISWNVWEIGRNKNWGFMVTSGIDVEPNFLRQLAIEASTAGCLLNKTLWSYWYATKKTWRMKLVRLRWKPWFNGHRRMFLSISCCFRWHGMVLQPCQKRCSAWIFHHFRAKKNQFMRVNSGE